MSNGSGSAGSSTNMNTVSTSAPSQEASQQNSANDSGISLTEGDLLGVLVDGGMNKEEKGSRTEEKTN